MKITSLLFALAISTSITLQAMNHSAFVRVSGYSAAVLSFGYYVKAAVIDDIRFDNAVEKLKFKAHEAEESKDPRLKEWGEKQKTNVVALYYLASESVFKTTLLKRTQQELKSYPGEKNSK